MEYLNVNPTAQWSATPDIVSTDPKGVWYIPLWRASHQVVGNTFREWRGWNRGPSSIPSMPAHHIQVPPHHHCWLWKKSFFSASYIPENIMDDRPSDQTSRCSVHHIPSLCPITVVLRWSSDTNSPPQYLVLRWLSVKWTPPLISLTLQTGEASHCNQSVFWEIWKDPCVQSKTLPGENLLQPFRWLMLLSKVLGGMEEDSMLDLLDSGLRNDNVTETFSVR